VDVDRYARLVSGKQHSGTQPHKEQQMIGSDYTSQQLRNRLAAGYTTVTYYAYSTDQHARGDIHTWHKTDYAAQCVAQRDATNHLGVMPVGEILFDRECHDGL